MVWGSVAYSIVGNIEFINDNINKFMFQNRISQH